MATDYFLALAEIVRGGGRASGDPVLDHRPARPCIRRVVDPALRGFHELARALEAAADA